MNMGEKIKMLRLERNMTLEQLGDLVGVGKSTVRKWENGMIANMRRDKISKIADALCVSPAFLMGWDDDDEPVLDSPELPCSVSDRAMQIALSYDQADERTKTAVEVALGIDFEKDRAAERSCG